MHSEVLELIDAFLELPQCVATLVNECGFVHILRKCLCDDPVDAIRQKAREILHKLESVTPTEAHDDTMRDRLESSRSLTSNPTFALSTRFFEEVHQEDDHLVRVPTHPCGAFRAVDKLCLAIWRQMSHTLAPRPERMLRWPMTIDRLANVMYNFWTPVCTFSFTVQNPSRGVLFMLMFFNL